MNCKKNWNQITEICNTKRENFFFGVFVLLNSSTIAG